MRNCTCLILDSNSSGFFCKIPFFEQTRYLNALLVNYDSINYNVNEGEYPTLRIVTSLHNEFWNMPPYKEISLNEERRLIIKLRKFNITLIEMKAFDHIPDFFDLELSLNKEEKYLQSKELEKSLFFLESKDGIDLKISHGLFSEDNKLIYIPPKPNNDNNYKGWPLLSPNDFKVIGIHCGSSQSPEFAKGTFIRFYKQKPKF